MDNKITVYGQFSLQAPLDDKVYMEKPEQEKLEIYKALIIENNNLKIQLTGYTIAMSTLINELSEQKAKNQILSEKLKDQDELNKKIESLTKENNDLKKLITDQGNKIQTLEKENANLNNRMEKMEMKFLFDKYIIAIQDVNRSNCLEININNKDICKQLKKLRCDRVNECHYLDEENDDHTLINDKKTILVDKINAMPSIVKDMFNKKYPGLLDSVLPCIIINKTIPSQDNINEICGWWEY